MIELGAQITFSPRWWSLISSTRVFVESFCSCSFDNADFSNRVSLSMHELLENAARYSAASNSPISCAFYIGESKVFAKVTNVAEEDQIATLREEFKSVCQGNPMEIYIAKMQRALTSEKSQLGLARIRYEGQAELLLDIDLEGVVTIEASFDI